MHQFFITSDKVRDGRVVIEGSDVSHIKNVLRMKPGDEIRVCDGISRRFLCEIKSIGTDKVTADILREEEPRGELPSKIYLFQGLPKGDKMDFIIQKAVELGARGIIPVQTERSVIRMEADAFAKKQARWQRIAESAAKQSGRDIIPAVSGIMTFAEAIKEALRLDVILMPYELASDMKSTREVLGAITPGQSIGVFIGPEGGFDADEAALAKEAGARLITLGKRILRTETAPLAVLSVLMYLLED